MDMSEKDIDARVLKYFVGFDQLVEDHGFETMLGVGSPSDDGYRDRMKQRCKLLIAGLAPTMLKVEIERLVLLQNKDAKTDDVVLRDLILQRATAQQHYHLMQLEEKRDKRAAVTSGKKTVEAKSKTQKSTESTAKPSEKKSGPREGCWICKGSHFAQQCPTATDAQKTEAKKRYDESRARKVKAARIAKTPRPHRVVINEVLEIPFRINSGADCCFLPEEYLRELQAIAPSIQASKLDQPVPVELAGGKFEYCHSACMVDLLLDTKADPVHVRRVNCLILPGAETEFLLGDDLLKALRIDVDNMMEQLAAGSNEQDDGDDLDDEPEVGQDVVASVTESLEKLVAHAEMNGFFC
ncbi:hypothetical protein DVH05_024831 [Phytophthora capsici]|nr:hypothetical protein DVH05_024831 [Phytophthora capsici]